MQSRREERLGEEETCSAMEFWEELGAETQTAGILERDFPGNQGQRVEFPAVQETSLLLNGRPPKG